MKIAKQIMTKPALKYQPRKLVGLSSRVAIAALLMFSGGTIATEQHHLAEIGVSGDDTSPTQELINWNDSKISWQSYEAGLKTAKSIGKQIIIVFYTDWCPQSKQYSQVFQEQRVIDQSKKFVMVRLNTDERPEINKLYLPDGKYVPRTIFFSSSGKPNYQLHAETEDYKYFLDNESPDELLYLMEMALKQPR